MTRHVPVLMHEAISHAHLTNGMTVVDATLGGGGYTLEIARLVGPTGRVIAFDRDKQAIARFEETSPELLDRVTLVHGNFADIARVLQDRGVVPDAVIADLGISSDQLDDPERGLSFLADGPLDMRLDQSGQSNYQPDIEAPTAAELIATLEAPMLADIFRKYGDEPFAMPIARAIVAARAEAPVVTTKQLADLIVRVVPQRAQKPGKHAATRVFQALRIAVNHEYDDLEKFLVGALDVLTPGGYLSVVSFHSGEDTMVKHFMRAQARGCVCPIEFPICQCGNTPHGEIMTKKPVGPSEQEIADNPRSRSAKLRVLKKVRA